MFSNECFCLNRIKLDKSKLTLNLINFSKLIFMMTTFSDGELLLEPVGTPFQLFQLFHINCYMGNKKVYNMNGERFKLRKRRDLEGFHLVLILQQK